LRKEKSMKGRKLKPLDLSSGQVKGGLPWPSKVAQKEVNGSRVYPGGWKTIREKENGGGR